MHTFEKDGFRVACESDLSGWMYFNESRTKREFDLPPGFLQAWLSHAGYELVPKEKLFRFHWRGGGTNEGMGQTPEDAFSRLGFGGGAVAALDYYEEVKPEDDSEEGNE